MQGSVGITPAFLTASADEGEWSALYHSHFTLSMRELF
jgi:hypothetical protein